jgi:intracellular multiplication protein IcmK
MKAFHLFASVALAVLNVQPTLAQDSQALENLLLPSTAPVAVQPQPMQVPGPQSGASIAIPDVGGGYAQAQQVPVDPYGQQPQAQPAPEDDFQKALDSAFAMTPAQTRAYRGRAEDNNRASVAPLSPGRPVSRSLRLTLKPGESTPVIHVEPGVVSTLTFSDGTAQPWPVESVVTGNPEAFVAQSAGPAGKSNIIVISALQNYVPSNLVVTLLGHPVPISMVLATDAADTDYRVDIQLSSRGPNALAQAPAGVPLAPTDDATIIAFLDGVPPTGASKLRTTSRDVDAWSFDDMIYVRTPGEIMSPGYVARSSNVSGVNVFSMSDTPVVLISQDGRMSSIQISR